MIRAGLEGTPGMVEKLGGICQTIDIITDISV